jgi:hypothetical protein
VNRSKTGRRAKQRWVNMSVLLAMIVTAACTCTRASADFPDPTKLTGVSWGPVAHNLQFGIVLPASVRSGEPIEAQLYVRNIGPLVVIGRRGDWDEYRITIKQADGSLMHIVRRPGGFTSDGQMNPNLRTGNVYHTKLDIAAQYSLPPGVYTVKLYTDVFTGFDDPDKAPPRSKIATLETPAQQVVVR